MNFEQLEEEIEKLKIFLTPNRIAKIDEVLAKRTDNFRIILDRFVDMHNISAVIRSCEAFGLLNIDIIKNNIIKNEMSASISKSTHKWLDIKYYKSPDEFIPELKAAGYKVWIADTNSRSKNVKELVIPDKLALVMGSELNGPSEDTIKYADEFVYLPMKGFVESFNVSVATALFIFYITENKDFAPISKGRFIELKNKYYRLSIKKSDIILEQLK